MVGRLLNKLRSPGLRPLVRRGIDKVLAPRFSCYAGSRALFEEKTGLEVGGPSALFRRRGLYPVYTLAGRLDNCNFGSRTVWGGGSPGDPFQYDSRRAPGRQHVAEATSLDFAADAAYEFLLSSHMLEHSANPLKALGEWQRVVRPGGALFLVLPHKDGTFDHRRPVTSLQHLIADYEQQMGEDDLTHLQEILALHDLKRDPEAGTPEEFRARSLKNLENRCLHQHVFDTRFAVEVVNHAGLQILAVETAPPFHIAILARKVVSGGRADNGAFMNPHGAL